MSIRWWPRKVLHTRACSSWKHSLRRPRHDRAVIERTVRADRIIVGVAADSGRIAVAISASQAISSRPSAIRPVLTQSAPRMRLTGSGRASHRRRSKRLRGRPVGACEARAAATVATISARLPSVSRWTRKRFALWGRKTCCYARASPHQAQNRQCLKCPVLYRSGAPWAILD